MVTFSGEAAKYATKFVNSTNCHVFLTGKAGTGKTTFLKYITENSHKNTIVAAPTGIAAINAGGVTLHSLFQLPFGTFLPSNNINFNQEISIQITTPDTLFKDRQMNKVKRNMLQELELLIIDEVSMLRADLLDAIDLILQSIRRNRRPFGGVQILFIGDLWQLPPVVKDAEWNYLKQFYSSIFFFEARALKKNKPLFIELEKIYRQSDMQFINLLNNLRNSEVTPADIETLNRYYKPEFAQKEGDGYIQLVTHNYQADNLNKDALQNIPDKTFFFDAEINGDFKENQFPVDHTLELKKGAQVMFIKNDYSGEGRYFNGKIGVVSDISDSFIEVEFNDDTPSTEVDLYEWENKRYTLNKETNLIEEKILGTFMHYPLKLAWAITVHKSQGLTFERAIIDVSKAFAPGQVYVALSRLVSLQGLVLTARIPTTGLKPDKSLTDFADKKPNNQTLNTTFTTESHQFISNYIVMAFDFKVMINKIGYHVESYNKDENRSAKQQYLTWAKEIHNDIIKLKEVSDKFMKQLKSILESKNPDYKTILYTRLIAAKEYFEPLLKEFSDRIFKHMKVLKHEKKIKKYLTELQDIELLFFRQLQIIYKAEALVKASIEDKILSKKDLNKSLFATRNQMLDNNKTVIKRKKIKSIKEKKEPKINTRELSYNLYKQGKSIKEIASERDFVITTIESHLAGYVAQGEIKATEFISEEKLATISKAITNTKSTQLGDLMNNLGNAFTYSELRIGVAHYLSKNPKKEEEKNIEP